MHTHVQKKPNWHSFTSFQETCPALQLSVTLVLDCCKPIHLRGEWLCILTMHLSMLAFLTPTVTVLELFWFPIVCLFSLCYQLIATRLKQFLALYKETGERHLHWFFEDPLVICKTSTGDSEKTDFFNQALRQILWFAINMLHNTPVLT